MIDFSQVPVDTFGRQLAFNIIPARLASGQRELERRIATEVTRLLGTSDPRFTVRLITAPVFYGHGLQLRFRLERQAALGDVRELLAGPNHVGASFEDTRGLTLGGEPVLGRPPSLSVENPLLRSGLAFAGFNRRAEAPEG